MNMDSLGETIRKLRLEKELPLRTVAAYLDIDQAILSKIERGQRNASRETVVKLAEYFNVKESDLLVAWLSDKLLYEVGDEDVALRALQVAEEKIGYLSPTKKNLAAIVTKIKKVLQIDGRVAAAWLYGSMATGEEKPDSDADIIIEFNDKKKYSMFDLLDIAHKLENKIDRKVDLVEKGQLEDFALKSAKNNLLKIYG
jgi:predicted nucleotidyltransferase/DNA-binding XRE family transcriptional regulator